MASHYLTEMEQPEVATAALFGRLYLCSGTYQATRGTTVGATVPRLVERAVPFGC